LSRRGTYRERGKGGIEKCIQVSQRGIRNFSLDSIRDVEKKGGGLSKPREPYLHTLASLLVLKKKKGKGRGTDVVARKMGGIRKEARGGVSKS